MLSTEAARFGVGVARRGSPGSPGTWFITQVFARPAEPPARLELRGSIESQLEERRAERGLATPLDPRLADLAARVAGELSDGRWIDQALQDRLSNEIEALGFGGAAWRTVYGQAWDAEGLRLPADLESGELRAVGVGVAVPAPTGSVRPATYVVVVVE
jgi:hypothetical protein